MVFALNAYGFCPKHFGFWLHIHMRCDAFTDICAFTVNFMEFIHSTLNALHCMSLFCICLSLHFWLLHSVAFVCMLTYVHSRRVAFVCIRPPPCILIHSETVALLQLCIHRTFTRILIVHLRLALQLRLHSGFWTLSHNYDTF